MWMCKYTDKCSSSDICDIFITVCNKHQSILCSFFSDWFFLQTHFFEKGPHSFTYCPLTAVEASQTDEEESLCCWLWARAVDGTGWPFSGKHLRCGLKSLKQRSGVFTLPHMNKHMTRLSLCGCKHHTQWPMRFICTPASFSHVHACDSVRTHLNLTCCSSHRSTRPRCPNRARVPPCPLRADGRTWNSSRCPPQRSY